MSYIDLLYFMGFSRNLGDLILDITDLAIELELASLCSG